MATIHKKPIKSRTKLRAAEERIYRMEVKEALLLPQNQHCFVWKVSEDFRNEWAKAGHVRCPMASQVHHKYLRRGRLLLWRPGWRFVSEAGHAWIERNRTKAVELGLLGPTGTLNDYERAFKHHQQTLKEAMEDDL